MKRMRLRKSLTTNIVVIFIIFNTLSIMLFSYYVMGKEEGQATEYAKESIQEILAEKSKLISITFERLESQTRLLGTWMEKLLAESNHSDKLKSEYIITDGGTIIRQRDSSLKTQEQSCIMIPNTSEKSKELFWEINLTEELDKPFEEIIKREDVTWAYIVTRNNILRSSPFLDVTEFYEDDHSQKDDEFYVVANQENNPSREPVWTKPYTDYFGKGWTMTCSQPVYDKENELFGVICLDVAVENIKEKYFENFTLGETGQVYWLSNDGNIIYHPVYSDEAVTQGEVSTKNIFDQRGVSEEQSEVLRKALSDKEGLRFYKDQGEEKLLVYAKIDGAESTLFIELNNKEFLAENKMDLGKLAVLILIDLMVAMLFSVMLYNKFSKPMKSLVNSADRISAGDYSFISEGDDDWEQYYEIGQLKQAFRTMNTSIEDYTDTLLEKNREISTILETIEGSMMIVNINGTVRVQSKETQGVLPENMKAAIEKIMATRLSATEQVVVNGEVYRNVYYPLIKENGDIEDLVISSECITLNTLMEKEIQQIEKMAGVGQLAAAIVHELKNTLALIKGATYILELTEEDGKNSQEIATIKQAVEEAENVITTLLDFSRKAPDGSEMIHMSTLINQILLLIKKETIAKNIEVTLDIDNSCYSYSSGREAIKVILQNIINNAVQAVGFDGKINISCKEIDEEIRISVRDDGGGILMEPKERVFEPFMSNKDGGTGIGLWITKRLITSLNGSITINDDLVGETEFVITIPKTRG